MKGVALKSFRFLNGGMQILRNAEWIHSFSKFFKEDKFRSKLLLFIFGWLMIIYWTWIIMYIGGRAACDLIHKVVYYTSYVYTWTKDLTTNDHQALTKKWM